ncbi:inner membrane transporter RhtA [Pedobacter cryoconitis]|uniref:Inner membrane transporter RhtA n=1 Tax=Pedobacter cryoconitis TaxID=188932 RepID=A0A7W9E200_9SPHI|nr:DMT family transporter [Pedobacter cryoconitis]MBB5638784.1 inner membrane transporter RhtA [Pedobacter cryoconitis]MBB6270207.1 inner membrane transporter RhtA [Pedobacter cryoconitis]
MNNNKSFNIPPIPAVLLSIVSVQCGAAIAKGLFPVLGAQSTALIRIGLSAIILMAVNRTNLKKLTPAQWKAVIPYGVSLGLMNLIFYMAIERIPLGLGVTLEFVGPLIVAIFGSKRITDYLWILLAGIGIALIAPWTDKGIDLVGVLLALTAGGFWAGYIVMGGKISKIMNGGDAVTVGMLFAALVVAPFGISSGGLTHLTPMMLLFGLALALLSSAIPFTLEINALRQMPARTFSILMSLEPAIAALNGLVLLHEVLTFSQWLAVGCVIIASAGATLTTKKAVVQENV